MKLKQWLREYCQMTYAEYKALEDVKRWQLEGEFKRFNRNKQIHDSQNWRPMTEEIWNCLAQKGITKAKKGIRIICKNEWHLGRNG